MKHMIIQAPASSLAELIRERRSIRAFEDRSVPRDLVADILREALWAPSPHNSQPWRFTALFASQDKEQLADAMARQLAAELATDGLEADAIVRQTERSRRRISTAPVVILCSLVREGLVAYPDERRNVLEFQMAVQSVGAVVQTIFLLAHAHGLRSCWMAAPMYCPEIVRATLALSADYRPQALVLVGYSASSGKVRERRSFTEVVELR
jgi:F420 biosynthesis protein FbiB-like protein